MRNLLILVFTAVAAAGAGYVAYRHWWSPTDTLVGATLPEIAGLTDLDGHPHQLDEWPGKLVLVNFWATWCGPCLKEMPELSQAQEKYAARGLQLVGPAVDDPESVRAMLASLRLTYPVLVSGSSDLMIKGMEMLNNTVGGLPFSVLVGTDGRIITEHLGPLSAEELSTLVEPHLPK